jgi:DNA-binding transcriptional regulator LsrR (DeoR family)
MKRKFADISDEAIAVALLKGQGYQQSNIADALMIPDWRVAELKQEAIDKCILTELKPRFETHRVDPTALKRARTLSRTKRLCRALQNLAAQGGKTPALQEIHTFDTGGGRTPDSKRRGNLGIAASEEVYELIRKPGCVFVGVAYGETIRALISGIARIENARRPHNSITFIPLRGDPPGAIDTRTSPTSLSMECRDVVDAHNRRSSTNQPKARSLAGVPAIIPAHFTRTESKAVRKLAECSREYTAIFGKNGDGARLIDRVDCIITSIGSVDEGLGDYSREYLRAWAVGQKWEHMNLLGDLAGILIPRPTLSTAEVKEVLRRESSWIGANRDVFQKCASKAADRKKPGVIVVAWGGAKKAAALYEACVTLNMVNHLVLDCALEDHLYEIVEEKGASSTLLYPRKRTQLPLTG